jgi:hypothetical protein
VGQTIGFRGLSMARTVIVKSDQQLHPEKFDLA